ncbi:MAG: hypothetical protein EHM35_02525 [Planctomycetaceae bacterium]|nr:MAG: hypothetical protein EHM35_02525 [Planctomycetaceae bacterium]
MTQKTRRKGTGLLVVGIAGLLVSAYFQIGDNKEEAERKGAKVTLIASSLQDTRANAAYGLGEVPGKMKPWKLKLDPSIEFNARRESVIVPKGTLITFLVAPLQAGPVFCTIIYMDNVVEVDDTFAKPIATCKFTPR